MILDIIDRKNKIVNISENLLSDGDSIKTDNSQEQDHNKFKPKASATHAKKRNFQQAIKDNVMR